MNRSKVFFIVWSFPQILLAQGKVWIKTPQMPLPEFKAHVRALGPSHTSYGQDQLREKRALAQSFQLKNQLLKAQQLWLSGEGKKAVEAFKRITRRALKADWDEEDRRIILYSFLRIAQSETNKEKRKAVLLSSAGFASFQIKPENYPDHSLFPPPLIEELSLLWEKTNSLSLDWESIFPQHEIILINGRPIKKNQKAPWPQAFYRITALSSSHQPWSQNLNLSELTTQKIKTKSLTKGPCANPQIQKEQPSNVHILPFSKCPPPATLRFEKKSSQIKETAVAKEEKTSAVPPWLILGAGVVILSLVISLSQKDEDKTGDYVY